MKKAGILLMAILSFSFAQRDKYWTCGDSSLIKFSQSGPAVYKDTTMGWGLNTSTISDDTGNLLFYSDGQWLYNRYGKRLVGTWTDNYQFSILLPDKMNKNFIHFIYLKQFSGILPIHYALIDIHANNDSGAVVSGPTIIYTPTFGPDYQVSPGLTATLDVNNQYWWMVAQELNYERFVKFKVGNGTVEGPFLQDITIPHSSGSLDWLAAAAFSNNGTKYAIRHYNGKSMEYLFDFDRCTGVFSNLQLVDSSSLPAGFGIPCFSPNDSLLYFRDGTAFTYSILQYYLFAPDISASKQTLCTLPTNHAYGVAVCSRAAIDGRLYFGIPNTEVLGPAPPGDTGYLAVVHYPNVYGPGCLYEEKFLKMPGNYVGDIPNMPLYTTPPLTAQQADCGYDTVTLTLGDSVLLGQPDTSLGKCTFAWFPSTGLNNASLAQPWCKPTTSGWYHLIVHDTTLASPCAQTEDSVYVQVNAVGLEDLLSSNASAWYPNPGTGTFWLRVQLPPGVVLTCTVTDLAGREVASTLTSDSEGLRLTLPEAPAGVYFIRTQSAAEGSVRMDKVVVR